MLSDILRDDGLVFIHIFTHKYGNPRSLPVSSNSFCPHRDYPYHFEVKSEDDWMTKFFFQGGQMPSHDLFLFFQRDLILEKRWAVDGRNYAKTSELWLQGMDAKKAEVLKIFEKCYGKNDASRWVQRWRMFYLAVAEFFATNKGSEWLVSHYLFSKRK